MLYTLPQSLAVKPSALKLLKGEIVAFFGDGLLSEHGYHPLGINALWALVGAVASLEKPFSVEIREGMTAQGYMVGFSDGVFCFFGVARKGIEVYTQVSIEPQGAKKITVRDVAHGTFFWVPSCAMIPFETLIRVGNSVLFSGELHTRTYVGQKYENWQNDLYTSTSEL